MEFAPWPSRHKARFLRLGLPELRLQIAQHYQQYDGLSKSLENAHHTIRYSNPDLLTYYLSTIHPEVLLSFMHGRATLDKYDPRMGRLLQAHDLDTLPSVYVNVVCRKEYDLSVPSQSDDSTQKSTQHAGNSLSINQLGEVLALMKNYATTSHQIPDKLINGIEKAVDKSWDQVNVKPDHLNGRRFVPSPRAQKIILDWVQTVDKQIVRPARTRFQANRQKLDQPLDWCFQEVGFGVHGAKRALQHAFQQATNYLLGLFYACTCYRCGGMFELKQFRLFHVAEPEHANFLEEIGSFLCGSYGFDTRFGLGLNPTFAGGAHMTGDKALNGPKYATLFTDAQKHLGKVGYVDTYKRLFIQAEAELSGNIQAKNDIPAKKQELEDAKSQERALRQEIESAKDAKQKLKFNFLANIQSLKGSRKRAISPPSVPHKVRCIIPNSQVR